MFGLSVPGENQAGIRRHNEGLDAMVLTNSIFRVYYCRVVIVSLVFSTCLRKVDIPGRLGKDILRNIWIALPNDRY